jgi:hypothetical protein
MRAVSLASESSSQVSEILSNPHSASARISPFIFAVDFFELGFTLSL